MQKIEVPCPNCGDSVVLVELGSHLGKLLKKFDYFYEGWCPGCSGRVVQHEALPSFEEHNLGK